MCGVIFFYLKKLCRFLFRKVFGYDHRHSLPSAKQDLQLNKTHTFSTNHSNDSIPSVPTTLNFSTSLNTPQTVPGPSRSSHSHAVCNKPVLSCDPSHSTSRHAKSKYNVVEKSSASLYVIPEDIKCLIKQDIVPEVLKKPLTPQTYKDYFTTLLYAEDFYHEKWEGFELKNVTLKLHVAEIRGRKDKNKNMNKTQIDDKSLVEIELDAICEKRPFLLSRDFAYVRPSGREVDPFQGIIFRVIKTNIVLVEFGDDFHAQHHPSFKYDIKLSFNRVCLKRTHQAIAAVSEMVFRKFLFPGCRPNDSYSPAYLVEGPLSVTRDKSLSKTGMVIQGAVVQLCQASSHNKILICAPLNNTCDVFTRSLRKEIGDSNIFRANAAFRELDGVPVDILPFCPYKEKEETFSCPSLSQLLNFKVIVTTFMSSFRLHNEGIEGGHFTHIFLVDACYVSEPEILVPLTNLTSVSTNVVVTGCPGTKSCWVRSELARQNGLRTSYFERLWQSKLYKDPSSEYITRLTGDATSST
ncbi:putative RNA helicase SDE3 [Heracleum sosnowskyi]|uniref:RNA helicase SDE3 n=1 Tax=Heracleum sosnowskyi TaxID=360622 RepID=A0AAD8ISG1_9APIA|nr:putative RNA helicase SDE3 [Heracleum sosnowskyi]